jgi:hypothetical protein
MADIFLSYTSSDCDWVFWRWSETPHSILGTI